MLTEAINVYQRDNKAARRTISILLNSLKVGFYCNLRPVGFSNVIVGKKGADAESSGLSACAVVRAGSGVLGEPLKHAEALPQAHPIPRRARRRGRRHSSLISGRVLVCCRQSMHVCGVTCASTRKKEKDEKQQGATASRPVRRQHWRMQ